MTDTKELIAKLARLAEKATPGEWTTLGDALDNGVFDPSGTTVCDVPWRSIIEGHPHQYFNRANRDFIAACHPQAILEIARHYNQAVYEGDKAREERNRAEAKVEYWKEQTLTMSDMFRLTRDERDKAREELNQAEAAVKQLRAERESWGNEYTAVMLAKDESDRLRAALEHFAKCGGCCDGPLGCMCGSKIAREALAAHGSKDPAPDSVMLPRDVVEEVEETLLLLSLGDWSAVSGADTAREFAEERLARLRSAVKEGK